MRPRANWSSPAASPGATHRDRREWFLLGHRSLAVHRDEPGPTAHDQFQNEQHATAAQSQSERRSHGNQGPHRKPKEHHSRATADSGPLNSILAFSMSVGISIITGPGRPLRAQ